jgi:anti-anti-sigma regulatory factor
VFSDAVKAAVTGADSPVRHVVVDMEAITDADVTSAESFEGLREWLGEQRVALSFSRIRPETRVRIESLGILHDDPVFETNRAALAALTAPDPHSEAS